MAMERELASRSPADDVESAVDHEVAAVELAETVAVGGGVVAAIAEVVVGGVADPIADGVWAAAATIGDQSAERLAELDLRRKQLAAEKEQIAKDIRNTERKRIRLMERAKGLSDSDLMAIVASRATAKAKASAKAKAKAKAAA